MSRAEAVLPPAEKYLVDLCDPISYAQVLLTQPAYVRRGGLYPLLLGPVWDSASGWLSDNGGAGQGSIIWAVANSAAATVKTRFSTKIVIPIGCDLALCPAVALWPLRYRIETLVWRVTSPLIANAPLSFVHCQGGAVSSLAAHAFAGYELLSDSTINGGRWTARVRLADAGGIVTLGDSGVDPAGGTTQTHIEMRYDATTNPRLSFLINGVELASSVLQGVANLPVFTGSGAWPGLAQGLAVGGGAAQKDRQRQTRFRIEQLVGFPE